MDYFAVAAASLVVAALTLVSGFGLGSLLMPVFALLFPLDVAVGATAIVHLANNLFKLGLVGKYASWPVAIRFGVPAIPAAFVRRHAPRAADISGVLVALQPSRSNIPNYVDRTRHGRSDRSLFCSRFVPGF